MHDTGTSITASSSNYKRKDVMCEAESNSERASILKVRGSSGHTETSQMREEGKKKWNSLQSVVECTSKNNLQKAW